MAASTTQLPTLLTLYSETPQATHTYRSYTVEPSKVGAIGVVLAVGLAAAALRVVLSYDYCAARAHGC